MTHHLPYNMFSYQNRIIFHFVMPYQVLINENRSVSFSYFYVLKSDNFCSACTIFIFSLSLQEKKIKDNISLIMEPNVTSNYIQLLSNSILVSLIMEPSVTSNYTYLLSSSFLVSLIMEPRVTYLQLYILTFQLHP